MQALVGEQLEGVEKIRHLNATTNRWDWVETPYGRLYLAGNDDGVALRYAHGYVYEPVSLGLWSDLCATADVVLDVGAHTGIYSLAAFKAGAETVLSVEPYYLNAARLDMNLRGNGYRPEILVAAAANREAVDFLYLNPTGNRSYCTAAGTLVPGKGCYMLPVSVRRLDTVIPGTVRARVSVMKFDVEFRLADALHGAADILMQSHPDLIAEVMEPDVAQALPPEYRYWHIDEARGLVPVTELTPRPMDNNRNYFVSVRPAPKEWLADSGEGGDG